MTLSIPLSAVSASVASPSPTTASGPTRLAALGYTLPAAPAAVGAYQTWARFGPYVTTSFQLPFKDGVLQHKGRLGEGVSLEQGMEAARICALNGLAQLTEAAGSFDGFRVIRIDGHVGCVEGFAHIPRVLDASSNLLNDVLGERGAHARTALGHLVMPLDAPVMLGFFAELFDQGKAS
ncbi:Atu1372/SO_1960 family protein [Trinickia fusca]|uniref:YjgF family translation initiation inhibitor n=1 Tax=Trinickia fusca TaxID=2419777 RepID=A0A494XBC3_9BURK|nr:Atu1372/SO_1960 family protein [Trinickia fusca]RKP46931.1 YjgF family translation initiation inhibitor [Trinickia fusca]